MPLSRELSGSVVLITGASEGIGSACARAFRTRGARLSLSGRSEAKLARIAMPEDLVSPVDLTAPGAALYLIARTVERFGRIDILINNAGLGLYRPSTQSSPEEIRALFDLNLFAPIALIQAALPHLRRHAVIVNVGSIAGPVALPWLPLYSASKAALGSFTESLRMELAHLGIHVVLVCPGYVVTDFQAHSLGSAPPPRVIAARRFAITPDQCAHAILQGVQNRARIVMTPRSGWLLLAAHRLLPRALESHFMRLMDYTPPEEPA